MKEVISNKLIHRLTLYHCILSYSVDSQEYVSSAEIASLLKIDDSQVRKDISFCGVKGTPKHGYHVLNLKKKIEERLSFDHVKNVFVIGAGHLASALTQYADFHDYGINILGLFDTDHAKIGTYINGKKVFDVCYLEDVLMQTNVDTVMLALPPQYAQTMTDRLVATGIKYIFNLTPCILRVPDDVIVWYENIVSSFLQMKMNT